MIKFENKMDNQDYKSSKLDGLKKDLPFRVPKGYFDDFPARMQQRIELEKQPAKSSTKVIELLKPMIGLAAAFAALILLVYFPVKTYTNRQIAKESSNRIENIVSDDFINLTENFDDVTFYTLLENENGNDVIETETLVSYLSMNLSEYDIIMETQN